MSQKWSFQLYSARNFQPWDGIFRRLGELGYGEVEGLGAVYGDPKATAAGLKANKLSMPSGHFSIADLEGKPDDVIKTAKTLGMRAIYCPFVMPADRPADKAGWVKFANRLSAIGKKMKAAGFEFGWHNHDFEFRPVADGSIPMQTILESAPGISWEADIAWIVRAGADPMKWIEKHGKRITATHVKDIAPAGEAKDEDGWADVGHGTMPWKKIIAAIRKAGNCSTYVMEHDKPSSYERFAKRSIEAARKF